MPNQQAVINTMGLMVVPSGDPAPYDALLLVSFGGPEQPEDVVPFLQNVTRGRGIPVERLVEVGAHYQQFGGKSPINDLNRAFLAAIREDFEAAGLGLPVYWGNRNWDPYLADVVREMRDDGVRRAACFLTSAYSSYSSCRQYREDLAEAVASVPGAPQLDRLRAYFNHPGFVAAVTDASLAAIAELDDDARHGARIVFVTHSIPTAMNAASGPGGGAYVTQHLSIAREVTDRIRRVTGIHAGYDVVYCSRSGAPHVPWLEPDINDWLRHLADDPAVTAAVMVPIGFVSDHMEVVYDLDTEAMTTAKKVGLPAVRAATAGLDQRFVAVVRDLLLERAATERGEHPERLKIGSLPASPDLCAAGCCRNLKDDRPALGGA